MKFTTLAALAALGAASALSPALADPVTREQAKADYHQAKSDAVRRVSVAPGFASLVYDQMVPGTTLVLTDAPIQPRTTGRRCRITNRARDSTGRSLASGAMRASRADARPAR